MIETAELYKLTGARQRCAALPLAHRLRPHREARLGDVFCHLRLVVSAARAAARRAPKLLSSMGVLLPVGLKFSIYNI